MGKHGVDVGVRNAFVCAWIEEDGVFPALADLNNGMAAGAVRLLQERNVHAAGRKRPGQQFAVLPNRARKADFRARRRGGDRLVQPFPAGENGIVAGALGLTRRDNMVKPIDPVNIAGAENKQFHAHPSFFVTDIHPIAYHKTPGIASNSEKTLAKNIKTHLKRK